MAPTRAVRALPTICLGIALALSFPLSLSLLWHLLMKVERLLAGSLVAGFSPLTRQYCVPPSRLLMVWRHSLIIFQAPVISLAAKRTSEGRDFTSFPRSPVCSLGLSWLTSIEGMYVPAVQAVQTPMLSLSILHTDDPRAHLAESGGGSANVPAFVFPCFPFSTV